MLCLHLYVNVYLSQVGLFIIIYFPLVVLLENSIAGPNTFHRGGGGGGGDNNKQLYKAIECFGDAL